MNRAISYLRFSSPKQQFTDSYRRQTVNTEKYCKANNLILDSRLEDLGVSAWTGKNLDDESALGGFLKMVKAGQIPKGTVLICENLDRISRGKILEAVSLFTQILKAGIEIVTTMDNKRYSYASVSANPMELMISITYLTRGNNESEVKSDRLKESWVLRRDNISKGKFAKFHCPSWLKHNGLKYERIEANADKVRLIFDLYLKGFGVYSLIKELNKRGVKSFTKSGTWKPIFIHAVLQNPAVIGTCERVSPPAKNYYPTVVSEETFYKAIAQRKQNHGFAGKSGAKEVNFFGGICKCYKCGSSMVKYSCKSKDKTKSYSFYICSQSRVGKCKYEFTNFNSFSYSFRSVMRLPAFRSFTQPTVTRKDNSEEIKGKLVSTQKTIERVSNAIVKTDSPSLVSRLQVLEIQRKQLETEYENERAAATTIGPDSNEHLGKMIFRLHTHMKDNEYRLQLRNFIRKNIKEIVVKPKSYEVTFKNSPEQITVNLFEKTFETVIKGKTTRHEFEAFRYLATNQN